MRWKVWNQISNPLGSPHPSQVECEILNHSFYQLFLETSEFLLENLKLLVPKKHILLGTGKIDLCKYCNFLWDKFKNWFSPQDCNISMYFIWWCRQRWHNAISVTEKHSQTYTKLSWEDSKSAETHPVEAKWDMTDASCKICNWQLSQPAWVLLLPVAIWSQKQNEPNKQQQRDHDMPIPVQLFVAKMNSSATILEISPPPFLLSLVCYILLAFIYVSFILQKKCSSQMNPIRFITYCSYLKKNLFRSSSLRTGTFIQTRIKCLYTRIKNHIYQHKSLKKTTTKNTTH